MPGHVRGVALRDWPRLARELGVNPDELREFTGLTEQHLSQCPANDVWLPLGVQIALLHGLRELAAQGDFVQLAVKLDAFVHGEVGMLGRLGLRAMGVRQAYKRIEETYRYIYRELEVSSLAEPWGIVVTLRGEFVHDPTWQWLQQTIHAIVLGQLGQQDADISGENRADAAFVLSIPFR